jgi:hypothetical protein
MIIKLYWTLPPQTDTDTQTERETREGAGRDWWSSGDDYHKQAKAHTHTIYIYNWQTFEKKVLKVCLQTEIS